MAQQSATVVPMRDIKKYNRKSVFIFDHGLGDFIHFLPVYEEFQRQAQMDVALASARSRQFKLIYPKMIDSEDIDSRQYGLIYRVHYPDTKDFSTPFEIYDEPSKPYLCAYYEMGMVFFVWTPYQIKVAVPKLKRIGVHFFGHTGSQHKFCDPFVAEQIWEEIKLAGYEPFECHMRPDFRRRYQDCGNDECGFIPENQTIRYQSPDLRIMRDEIGKCKYFIGVDSGPLYLATSVLGHENVIGLENKKLISYYCPKHISTISIREYTPGTILERIELMEGSKND